MTISKKKQGKQINPELEKKFEPEPVQIINPVNPVQNDKKRLRRTKDEIRQEKIRKAKDLLNSSPDNLLVLNDEGYQVVQDIIFSVHKNDVAKYGVPLDPKEFYEDFSKNIMKVFNFYTRGRVNPIYVTIIATVFQGFNMLKLRREIIEKVEKTKKDNYVKPDRTPNNEPNGRDSLIN